MKTLKDISGQELILIQPSIFKNVFNLLLSEQLVGTMEFTKIFSRTAKVELFNTAWEIKRDSFWKGEYGIYKYGYELPSAVYKSKLFAGSGAIKLPKGISLPVKFNIWKGITEVFSNKGKLLVTGKRKAGLKEKQLLIINNLDPLLEEFPWLLMFTAYLAVNRKKSAAYHG